MTANTMTEHSAEDAGLGNTKTHRILHLIDSSGFYGAENVIISLCKELRHTDFQPVLGCIIPENSSLPEVGLVAEKHGIEVIPIQQTTKYDWQHLKQTIKTARIDLIHAHGYKASVLSFLAENMRGNRILITCHLWTNDTFLLRIYAFLEAIVMKKARTVVAVSETIRDAIESRPFGRQHVTVIWNGIDLEEWSPGTADRITKKQTLGLREDSLVLGLFGRLTKQKGHEYLFRALTDIKADVELICVGDGPLLENLKNTAKRAGLTNIHFLEYRKDVKELLEITDIFVMPSLDEGLPMALLEAMAMGKAVIASRVGAIPSTITHEKDGILIAPHDVTNLRDAIIRLAESPSLRQQLGANARHTIQHHFSSKIMTRHYITQYQEAISAST